LRDTISKAREELIRIFNEALNENPGEHFTPREVIRLMVNLLLAHDKDALSRNHIIFNAVVRITRPPVFPDHH
jgi:type I restriction-modification system DNA methylase subunit